MDNKALKCLFDIRLAIEEINSFFEGKPKSFKNYKQDTLLKRGIERNLEIIGEAVNRILKTEPQLINRIKEAKNIIGLRNQIIHSYDNISDENIWSVVINHLGALEKDVNALINEASE